MCDTLIAVGEATADGSVILAKNSDRQPNEAHVLAHMGLGHPRPKGGLGRKIGRLAQRGEEAWPTSGWIRNCVQV